MLLVLCNKVVELLKLLNCKLPGLGCAHGDVCLYSAHAGSCYWCRCCQLVLLVLLLLVVLGGLHVHWSLWFNCVVLTLFWRAGAWRV